jgi:hypothetical protein
VRFRSAFIPALLAVLAGGSGPAIAQVVSTPVQPASAGWSFNLTPYFWLATFRANLQYNGPQGNTVTEDITAGINDYISHLNLAFMGGAEARDGRFSLLTDLVYAGLSFTSDPSHNSTAHLTRVNVAGVPIDIPRSLQLHTGSRVNAVIGQLAGGYTVLQGEWGNLDVIAGFRVLGVNGSLNWTLADDIRLPDGTIALSRNGEATVGGSLWNGIGGIRGRFNVPNSKFFFPCYLDAGGGGVPFTWQAYAGVGYQAGIADLSLGYRWLAFEQGGDAKVRRLALGGALLAAAFRF